MRPYYKLQQIILSTHEIIATFVIKTSLVCPEGMPTYYSQNLSHATRLCCSDLIRQWLKSDMPDFLSSSFSEETGIFVSCFMLNVKPPIA